MRKFTWLKLFLILVVLSLSTTLTALAGGILTNTNLSARYARLLALEASISVDAAYHNPAGTVKLPEGLHFAVANQTIFQERKITSSFGYTKDFIGKTSSPIVPSIQGVYKKDRWAFSGSFGVVGGGGKATFNDGLPSFESQLSLLPSTISMFGQYLIDGIPDSFIIPQGYSFNQFVEGQSYIFGFQLGAAYQINDMFSVYGGARVSVVNNAYEGHLTDLMLDLYIRGLESSGLPKHDGLMNPLPVFGMINNNEKIPEEWKDVLQLPSLIASEGAYLDVKQTGWGFAPISWGSLFS